LLYNLQSFIFSFKLTPSTTNITRIYLGDPVSAPPGLEAVVFPLHFDVGAFAVDGVGGAQVVESRQQIQTVFSLKQKSPNNEKD
jgi:hypothetical protein